MLWETVFSPEMSRNSRRLSSFRQPRREVWSCMSLLWPTKLKAYICNLSLGETLRKPSCVSQPESHDCHQWECLIWFSPTLSYLESKVGFYIPTSGSLCSLKLFGTVFVFVVFSIYWLCLLFFPTCIYPSQPQERKPLGTPSSLQTLHQLGQTTNLLLLVGEGDYTIWLIGLGK